MNRRAIRFVESETEASHDQWPPNADRHEVASDHLRRRLIFTGAQQTGMCFDINRCAVSVKADKQMNATVICVYVCLQASKDNGEIRRMAMTAIFGSNERHVDYEDIRRITDALTRPLLKEIGITVFF